MLLDRYGRAIPPEDLEPRQDGWENDQTGIGTAYDKTQHGAFTTDDRVLDVELKDLYNGSDIAAMAVEEPAREKFREGFDLDGNVVDETKSGAPTKGAPLLDSEIESLRDYATSELELEELFVEADIWGRLFGGCLLVMGIDDGRFPWEPVNEDSIRSVDYLSLVDRRFAYVQSQYSGMNRKRYGRAEIYLISNAIAGSGWNDYGVVRAKSMADLRGSGATVQLVHESRVIRFDGNPADVLTRQRLAGWSWSILQRIYLAMRQFSHAFDSSMYLLADASQAVFRLQGLVKAISAGRRDAVMSRMRLIEQSRSVARAVIIDAGDKDGKNAESFERTNSQFSGVSDLLEQMKSRFAAAARMPQTKLFGRSPAGMNATGDADVRGWYDSLRSDANTKIAPKICKVFKYVALAKNGPLGGKKVHFSADFRPLWSATDKEISDTQFTRAQADAIYLDREVVSPEQVAVGLKDEYPALPVKELEAAIEAKESFDPHGNDPDDPDPPSESGEPNSPSTPVQTMGPSAGPNVEGAAPDGTKAGAKAEGFGAPGAKAKADAGDEGALRLDALLVGRADGKAAGAVFRQLLQDYPASALGWVLAAHWEGPDEVPLDAIDSSGRESWAASHDGKLAKHVERMENGESDPLVLVKPPGAAAAIVDGHHRFLADEQLGRPALAYHAEVHVARGPWDELHSMQKRGSSGGASVPSWKGANATAPEAKSDADPDSVALRAASRAEQLGLLAGRQNTARRHLEAADAFRSARQHAFGTPIAQQHAERASEHASRAATIAAAQAVLGHTSEAYLKAARVHGVAEGYARAAGRNPTADMHAKEAHAHAVAGLQAQSSHARGTTGRFAGRR